MTVEPYELKGKTIKDAFVEKISLSRHDLTIEFTDGSKVVIRSEFVDDEITGNAVPTQYIQISDI